MEPEVTILNVFTNEAGEYGNPVGVIVDEQQMYTAVDRQTFAQKLGFSETVFIDSTESKRINIYTPKRKIPFAGHAVLGVGSYLLGEAKETRVISEGNEIPIWKEEGVVWLQSTVDILPDWNYKELSDPSEVDAITIEQATAFKHCVVWSWVDVQAGQIRARTFASDWGILEDEANGSGAMRLAATLEREVTVRHGKGSVICACPADNGFVRLGGCVLKK